MKKILFFIVFFMTTKTWSTTVVYEKSTNNIKEVVTDGSDISRYIGDATLDIRENLAIPIPSGRISQYQFDPNSNTINWKPLIILNGISNSTVYDQIINIKISNYVLAQIKSIETVPALVIAIQARIDANNALILTLQSQIK